MLCKLFCRPYCGMKPVVGLIVPSVEITSGHRCSVIANNYTIRVQHRNNLKDYSFPKLLGLISVAAQITEETLHHVARGRFSRMHSSGYDDVLLFFILRQRDSRLLILEFFQFYLTIIRVRTYPRSNR